MDMARLASGVTGTVHVSNVCKPGSGFHRDIKTLWWFNTIKEQICLVECSPKKTMQLAG